MKSSLLMFNYRTYLGFLRAKKDRNIIAFFFCKYCHTVAELSNATRKWSFLLLGLDVVSIRCVVLCHAINGVFLIFPISWVRLADILMRPNLIGSNPSSPLFFFFLGSGNLVTVVNWWAWPECGILRMVGLDLDLGHRGGLLRSWEFHKRKNKLETRRTILHSVNAKIKFPNFYHFLVNFNLYMLPWTIFI